MYAICFHINGKQIKEVYSIKSCTSACDRGRYKVARHPIPTVPSCDIPCHMQRSFCDRGTVLLSHLPGAGSCVTSRGYYVVSYPCSC